MSLSSAMLENFARLLETVPQRMVQIPDAAAGSPRAPGRWSPKQILGHLIDSAGNNHQRFVRAQLTARLEFPPYDQEAWVAAQGYATEPWPDLVNLWLLCNRHLLHVVKAIPAEKLSTPCDMGKGPMPLSAVIEDYVSHMERHLGQILS